MMGPLLARTAFRPDRERSVPRGEAAPDVPPFAAVAEEPAEPYPSARPPGRCSIAAARPPGLACAGRAQARASAPERRQRGLPPGPSPRRRVLEQERDSVGASGPARVEQVPPEQEQEEGAAALGFEARRPPWAREPRPPPGAEELVPRRPAGLPPRAAAVPARRRARPGAASVRKAAEVPPRDDRRSAARRDPGYRPSCGGGRHRS